MQCYTRRRWLSCSALLLGSIAALARPAADTPKHSTVAPLRRTDEGWQERQDTINARARQGNVDLLFIGDSITDAWGDATPVRSPKPGEAPQRWEGNAVWKKYYGPRNAMNAGISGDRTEHVLWRLDHGNIDGIKPKLIVLMIGTNNSSRKDNTAQDIADGISAIVHKLRKKLPDSQILVLAIFPRGANPKDPAVRAQRQKNAEASATAAKLADARMIHFLDIGPRFLDDEKRISKEIMFDALHLTLKGYQIWADSIEEKVVELMGETKRK